MKTLKNKFIAVLLIFAVVSLTAYTVKTSQTNSKKELMMVEIIFGFDGSKDVSGIYTTASNGSTTKTADLIGYVGHENIFTNSRVIHKYLKDTYANGWELESATGGDNAKRYIFRK